MFTIDFAIFRPNNQLYHNFTIYFFYFQTQQAATLHPPALHPGKEDAVSIASVLAMGELRM